LTHFVVSAGSIVVVHNLLKMGKPMRGQRECGPVIVASSRASQIRFAMGIPKVTCPAGLAPVGHFS
jgi:hypothetical protein